MTSAKQAPGNSTSRLKASPRHVEIAQLRRLRWAIRGALALGVAASVAANVLHAQPTLVGRVIAAWPPLALLLTIELISRVPVHRVVLARVRWVATAGISGIAAWVSYWHMVDVAMRYGESVVSAHLIPLSVDGLVVVASVCLVELAGRIRAAEPTEDVVTAVRAAGSQPGRHRYALGVFASAAYRQPGPVPYRCTARWAYRYAQR